MKDIKPPLPVKEFVKVPVDGKRLRDFIKKTMSEF